MMGLRNAEIIDTREPRETAKTVLENIDAIQREAMNELRMLADAVYRGNSPCTQTKENDEPRAEPIVTILERQRQTAQAILDGMIRIREALW